ncbi:MAG: hypothetical protein QXD80_01150 [Acidilobaceae archaeon]
MVTELEKSRDPRREAITLLRVLSYYYSFRDLEKMLGIHFQSLWRYATLNSVPEKDTAERILYKVRELNIIKSIIDNELNGAEGEYHILARSPGFTNILAYIITDTINFNSNMKLNSIIALSHDAISLATTIALNTEAKICYIQSESKLERGGFLTIHYKSKKYKELKSIIIPKDCIGEETNIAIVDIKLDDIDKILAVEGLAKKTKSKITLAAFIIADKESYNELQQRLSNTKILVLKIT